MVTSAFVFKDAKESDAKLLSSVALASKKHWGYPSEWFKHWKKEFDISPDFIRENKVTVAILQDTITGFSAVSIMEK